MDDIIDEIIRRAGAGERFAVGLLAHVQGSAPQKAGARLVVLADGTTRGTVGGGCLEMETRRRALLALRTGETTLFELRLDDDFGWDDGLICGGRTTLLVTPRPERMAPAMERVGEERAAGRRALLITILAAPDAALVGEALALPAEGGAAASLRPRHLLGDRHARASQRRARSGRGDQPRLGLRRDDRLAAQGPYHPGGSACPEHRRSGAPGAPARAHWPGHRRGIAAGDRPIHRGAHIRKQLLQPPGSISGGFDPGWVEIIRVAEPAEQARERRGGRLAQPLSLYVSQQGDSHGALGVGR